MTTFHEHIRTVLTEFDKFLDALKTEKLSKPVLSSRASIIEAIKNLREEFPALASLQSEKTLTVNERDVSNGSVGTTSSLGSGNVEEEDSSYSDNIPDTPTKDLTNPTKSGYLDKRKRKVYLASASHQKRYCVIKDRIFYYYQKNKDVKQNGAFNLEGYQFQEAPSLVKDSNKKELSFELVSTAKRSYQFVAESKSEFISWKAAILQGIGASSQSDSVHVVEGDMEDIYEDMEDIAEKVKTMDEPVFEQTDYDDAETLQHLVNHDEDNQELYSDVGNVEEPEEKTPAPVTPSPTVAKLSKPKMPLPAVPPSPTPTFKQEQPLPELPRARDQPPPQPQPQPPTPTNDKPVGRARLVLTVSPEEDYDNMYYGKWDCKADTDEELSFKHGDVIHVISREYDNKDWWVGRIEERFGLVPKNFLIRAYKAA